MIHDVAIIGGGPAGATTALALARAGRSVAVIEQAAFPRRKVCGEFMSATNAALLAELGLGAAWDAAGPPVRRVALFAGQTTVDASMPGCAGLGLWGRALARTTLDTAILERAGAAGAEIVQPARAVWLRRTGGVFGIGFEGRQREGVVCARTVVAAHGSWERGSLPTHGPRAVHAAGDLLAFKAVLANASLPSDLMPLLAFPGGYGGMVCLPGGLVSLSLCIRRDHLDGARQAIGGGPAGAAVLAHLRRHVRGVREATERAGMDGAWLAAGPIRPGMRTCPQQGVFLVGNLAGEAHPIVAEGLSMAIQAGHLLARHLSALPRSGDLAEAHDLAARRYEAQWQRSFAGRIRAAALFAALALNPAAARCAEALVGAFPGLLTAGAWASGKTAPAPRRRPLRHA